MPTTKLHAAAVLANDPVGGGQYRLVVRAPELAAAARPGQFVMVRVSEGLDPLLGRPLGIASVPTKTTVGFFYRVVGRGTQLLAGIGKGKTIRIVGPLGNGFPAPQKTDVPILVSGGTGFPPICFLASRLGPAGSRGIILIGARDRRGRPPAAALTDFRTSCPTVHFSTDDGSVGKRGLVTVLLDDVLARMKNPGAAVIYACGPKAMLRAVAEKAAVRSVRCFVSLEERMACGMGACMGCSVPVASGGYKRVCKEGPVFDAREIDWGAPVSSECGVQSAECGCGEG